MRRINGHGQLGDLVESPELWGMPKKLSVDIRHKGEFNWADYLARESKDRKEKRERMEKRNRKIAQQQAGMMPPEVKGKMNRCASQWLDRIKALKLDGTREEVRKAIDQGRREVDAIFVAWTYDVAPGVEADGVEDGE